MKKKYLLGILPALIALSACSTGAKNTVKTYVEDTLAHEELFGAANNGNEFELGQSKGLEPRRAYLDRSLEGEPNPLTKPVIGVQYQPLTNGYYALRYVAAIASLNVDAVWTRNICESNGNRRKTEESHFTCTKAYASLSVDGGVGLPANFGQDYHYFVVYTLKNIPESDLNSFLFGYLTLTYQGNSVRSDARIAKVDGGRTFTIETTGANARTGYFLEGYIYNSSIKVSMTATPSSQTNYAELEGRGMNPNDYFGVFRYEPEESETGELFQCFGFNQLRKGAQFMSKRANCNYMQVPNGGSYNIYLNRSNEVHVVAPDAARQITKLYFKPGTNWGTSARYALNLFNNDANPKTQQWKPLTQIGETGIYTCATFDGRDWPECQLVRLNPETSTYNWDGDWWSKTGNLNTYDVGNIFYVNNDASIDRAPDAAGNWNLYIPD